MIGLFTGPGPLAQLVRDELRERGIGAEIRSEEPLGQIYGSAASPAGFQSVIVTDEVAERRRGEIEEVLALVSDVELEEEPEGTSDD